jgi:EAL domain-containing protein (putative c-di-GMP-specific phosphodiesterase class I)
LKVDKSFIQNTEKNARDRVIVQKSIEMGHELDMKVVAEGVETQEQFEFLRTIYCDAVQGYLFSRPLPVEGLLRWHREYRP